MQLVDELLGLVSSQFGVMRELITMIKLETRLAKLSVFPLLLNLCLLFIVGLTLWGSAMVLAGFGLNLILHSTLAVVTIIWMFNLFILFALIKYLLFNLKKMSFEKTRHFLSATKECKNHELQKENH